MRAPPPLRWVCAPSPGWRGFEAGLFALAGAALVAWCAGRLGLEQPWSAAGVSIAAMAASIASWRLLPRPSGVLEWTGSAWAWQGAGSAEALALDEVSLAIDLSSTVLLRLSLAPKGRLGWSRRSLWVTARRHQDAAAWPALCALLHDPAAARRGAAPRSDRP